MRALGEGLCPLDPAFLPRHTLTAPSGSRRPAGHGEYPGSLPWCSAAPRSPRGNRPHDKTRRRQRPASEKPAGLLAPWPGDASPAARAAGLAASRRRPPSSGNAAVRALLAAAARPRATRARGGVKDQPPGEGGTRNHAPPRPAPPVDAPSAPSPFGALMPASLTNVPHVCRRLGAAELPSQLSSETGAAGKGEGWGWGS